MISYIVFLAGGLLNDWAFWSLEPMILAALPYVMGLVVLSHPSVGGQVERQAFSLTFAVGWLMAGVAAVYSNRFGDPFQAVSDPAVFYALSSGNLEGVVLPPLLGTLEGLGAIHVWRQVYELVRWIGLEDERYVGILVNVSAVAATSVLAVKIARVIFGPDAARLRRLKLMLVMCGMFWLFAGLHLRDGFILFLVTALIYWLVLYLKKPRFWSLALVSLGVGVASLLFALFRIEFAFVPVALLAAAVAGQTLSRPGAGNGFLRRGGLVVLATLVLGGLWLSAGGRMWSSLSGAYETYQSLTAAEESGTGSLGARLIVDQPLPVRVIPGMASLYLYPIPIWSGVQLESAYHLFRSFNAMFFYFVLPLMFLGLVRLWREPETRSSQLLFMTFAWIGTGLGVAATSLEGRHAAAFYVTIFILALLPDLEQPRRRREYRQALGTMFILVGVVHVSWMLLRL